MYEVLVIPRAQRDLDALALEPFRSVNEAILSLEREPRGHRTVKLTSQDGYRLSVGDFRILFRIDDAAKRVFVYRVKHRRDAYR